MPEPISFGAFDFNLVSSMEEKRNVLDSDSPFMMLLIGDFSGRTNRLVDKSSKDLAGLKTIQIDKDTFDEVLCGLEVKLELPLLGEKELPVSLSFSELNDFHPDSLYRNLDIFRILKETRKKLSDPKTCEDFADKLRFSNNSVTNAALPNETISDPQDSLLDQIIEQDQPKIMASNLGTYSTELGDFLQSIVSPHLVAKVSPKQDEMIKAVDVATADLMNKILHNESFKALEGAWRGLSFLVSRLESDSQLRLFLLDVSKDEFVASLNETDDLVRSTFYKLLVEQAIGMPGGQPWAVVAGNYFFDRCLEDIATLGRMAKIVSAAGCSFISAAGDSFLTEKNLAERPDPDDWCTIENPEIDGIWQALRKIPEAVHLGLVLPRFLLRLPYGADTDPIDMFYFEEMDSVPVHEKYLWGNSCFALMLLLGQSYSSGGGKMRAGNIQEIYSLPLHVYKADGQSQLKPCAEILLSQSAADQIINKGLMPLISMYNQDTVRLGCLQSIADPPTRLVGPWS